MEAEDRPTGQHVKTKIELRQEKTGIQNTDGWTKMHQPIKNGKECIKNLMLTRRLSLPAVDAD